MEIADVSTEGLPRIFVVAGPTAVGKSSFAVAVAEEIGGELVNADSVQLYRELDIGTAKPTPEQRERVPHHLFDVLDPDEESNVADYVEMASDAIAEIRERGRLPIVVGGTGMYIRVLVHGIFDAPEPDETIRQRYKAIAAEKGSPHLHEKLEQIDPELADKVHPNDAVRIIRGLEVFEQTGKPLSVHQREHRFQKPNFDALKVGLLRPRQELYDRINRRAEQMIDEGLVDEYRGLIERGYDRELKPLQSLGYRQMGEHVFDDVPLQEAVASMKKHTRRYAKQQISWFRSEPGLQWALAPVCEDGALPVDVRHALETFSEGGTPGMEWADLEPYDVERDA
jgi:tRNA dimethylallyltransferase